MTVGAPIDAVFVGLFVAAAGMAIGLWLSSRGEGDDEADSAFTGYGDGDLRIDQPVTPGPLSAMVKEALEAHGFTVGSLSLRDSEPGYWPRVVEGFGSISLEADNDVWYTEVHYGVVPARRGGEIDLSRVTMVIFLPDGWRECKGEAGGDAVPGVEPEEAMDVYRSELPLIMDERMDLGSDRHGDAWLDGSVPIHFDQFDRNARDFKAAVREGDVHEALKQLADVANFGRMALAIRRGGKRDDPE